ncbi:unnamed protein product [Adineta ricciae]|uniref:G domain-containing protein n=2 Tax=Adineta ricciae TaxID=249248 RepID=A0A813NXB8_ADIRI|nr:unnamed protein product [Adineta ricciae]
MLQRLKVCLHTEKGDLTWDSYDENLARNIRDTKIYSNIVDINHSMSLLNVCQRIQRNRNTHHIDTEQTIEQKLVYDINTDRIIYSTTALETKYREQLGNLRQKLMRDYKNNSVTELQDHKTVSILLLQSSGVGKSTFINTFANYLHFNTFDHAQAGKPLVLMPVSSIITTGDDFEEHILYFNDTNDPDNENFNHLGQSITQHCKSYEFEIDQTNGTKLCIVETPGFDDTRGIEQDDRNMREIYDCIKNPLSHIHGVCVLLKPNESRPIIYFLTYLTQLFSIFWTEN